MDAKKGNWIGIWIASLKLSSLGGNRSSPTPPSPSPNGKSISGLLSHRVGVVVVVVAGVVVVVVVGVVAVVVGVVVVEVVVGVVVVVVVVLVEAVTNYLHFT